MDERIGLVLEEARATLTKQHGELLAVRAKFSTLLTFAGVAAALLGSGAFESGADSSVLMYLGAAAFGVVVIFTLLVNIPREFTFSTDARTMLEEWDIDARTVDETGRYLARFLSDFVHMNQPKIDFYNRIYLWATLAVVLELLFLFFDLQGR